jgi:hypothetical protein
MRGVTRTMVEREAATVGAAMCDISCNVAWFTDEDYDYGRDDDRAYAKAAFRGDKMPAERKFDRFIGWSRSHVFVTQVYDGNYAVVAVPIMPIFAHRPLSIPVIGGGGD